MLWDRLGRSGTGKYLTGKGHQGRGRDLQQQRHGRSGYLISKGVLPPPYYVSFVLGMHRVNNQASRYSPKHLCISSTFCLPVRFLDPRHRNIEYEATTLSILMGGNVRVGFEDNVYIEKSRLAASNAEAVAKIVRIAKELGWEIASPDEAREMLGIPKL